MAIQWAPDFSTFIDTAKYPGAVWKNEVPNSVWGDDGTKAGFYTPKEWAVDGEIPSKLIKPFFKGHGNGETEYTTTPDYQDLKAAGLWDLSSPSSPTWNYLRTRAGGRDVQNDPGALLDAIGKAGVAEGTTENKGRADYEARLRDALGTLPNKEYVDTFVSKAGEQIEQYWASRPDDSLTIGSVVSDMARGFGDLLKETAPLWMSAAGAAFLPGISASFGGGVTGGAAAGATAGAVKGAVTGENIFESALTGGITGGALGGLGDLLPSADAGAQLGMDDLYDFGPPNLDAISGGAGALGSDWAESALAQPGGMGDPAGLNLAAISGASPSLGTDWAEEALSQPGGIGDPAGLDLSQVGATSGLGSDWAEEALAQPGGIGDPAGLNLGALTSAGALPDVSASGGSTAPESMGSDFAEEALSQPGGIGDPSGLNLGAITSAGAGTALSRILDGTATTADVLEVIGQAAPGVIGAIGANQQANSLEGLARDWMALGAPSRGRFEGSFAPGFTMENDPGYTDMLDQASNAMLRKLSVQGNPAGNPAAWAETLNHVNANFAYPALQDYRKTNASAGGLASFAPAAQDASGAAIGAGSRVYSDLGGAVGDVFNPTRPKKTTSLADFMRSLV